MPACARECSILAVRMSACALMPACVLMPACMLMPACVIMPACVRERGLATWTKGERERER
eukprot:7214782-Alexandrium_andersonii.AAC.1